MSLKAQVDNIEEVEENFRPLYQEQNGKFVLPEIEGLVPKSKVDEFRNNNIQLLKERDTLQENLNKYSDLDVEAAREAMKLKEDMENKKLMDEGQFEELLNKQIERNKAQFEKQFKAVEERAKIQEQLASEKHNKYSGLKVDMEVRKVLDKRPELTTAARMLISDRVVNRFSLDENDNVTYVYEQSPKYNAEGQPYGISDFVDDVVSEFQGDSSFVKPSSGGGSLGDTGSSSGVIGNTIRLSREDAKNPRVYQRAKAEAEKTGKRLVLDS